MMASAASTRRGGRASECGVELDGAGRECWCCRPAQMEASLARQTDISQLDCQRQECLRGDLFTVVWLPSRNCPRAKARIIYSALFLSSRRATSRTRMLFSAVCCTGYTMIFIVVERLECTRSTGTATKRAHYLHNRVRTGETLSILRSRMHAAPPASICAWERRGRSVGRRLARL